jgi:menaquinol-cytochrome c reductase iron-sulfur subunit
LKEIIVQGDQSSCCCCTRHSSAGDDNRRGFLGKAAAVICGGIGLLIPSVAGIVAFLNPLRQKSQSGEFMRLAPLSALPTDGTPRKVAVVADRSDAWSTYSAESIGAVFLRRTGENVQALQVICPHAGCSINFEGSGSSGKFFCPCHSASFDLDGKRMDTTSPSPRDMDTLEVEVRNKSEVWVKFQTFGVGTPAKTAQG